MKKTEEKIKLVKDWLRFARGNLLFAHSGMEEDYAPYHTICFLCYGMWQFSIQSSMKN